MPPSAPIRTTSFAPPVQRPGQAQTKQQLIFLAIQASQKYMAPELWEQIKCLFAGAALAVVLGVVLAWAASQFFGVGEIADAVMLVGGYLMIGASAFEVGQELLAFGRDALVGKTESAGKHFARAVTLAGVAVISAIFFLRYKPALRTELRPGFVITEEMMPSRPADISRFGRYKPQLYIQGIQEFAGKGQRLEGFTMPNGDIFIEETTKEYIQEFTFNHELVHRFFCPKWYFLRDVRVQVALQGYNRSYLLRYLEEAICQGIATFRARGFRTFKRPFGWASFPVRNGYVTISAMKNEAQSLFLGPINLGEITYNVFFNTTPPQRPSEKKAGK